MPFFLDAAILSLIPLSCDLALELRERQEHVQRQSPHARRRIERLGHRDEGHIVGVEKLDQFGEVGERPGQAINLRNAGLSIEPPENPPSS